MSHALSRCLCVGLIVLVHIRGLASAGEPQIADVDWEDACGGSNIRVTRVDGAVVAIDASVEHYHEARQWQCHFLRGEIVSALYRHSKVTRKAAAEEGAFTTELHDDVVTTFYFPDHKLTGMPHDLLEDLQTVLAKATQ
jgi:hypothetical protein